MSTATLAPRASAVFGASRDFLRRPAGRSIFLLAAMRGKTVWDHAHAAMRLRLLIVDDNWQFLDAASELLEREGMEVVAVACTIGEALARVDDLRPDVILVDIDLGGESGFDLARRLADAAGAESHRVVLISTYAEEDLRELIEASPALGFLSKSELSGKAIHQLLGAVAERGGAAPS